MKPDQANQSEDTFYFASLRRKLNLMLIRSAGIEVEDKKTEEITFGEVLGNMGALAYLILLLSLAVALVVGFLCAFLLAEKTMDTLVVLFLGGVGAIAGFLTWSLLFRLKR